MSILIRQIRVAERHFHRLPRMGIRILWRYYCNRKMSVSTQQTRVAERYSHHLPWMAVRELSRGKRRLMTSFLYRGSRRNYLDPSQLTPSHYPSHPSKRSACFDLFIILPAKVASLRLRVRSSLYCWLLVPHPRLSRYVPPTATTKLLVCQRIHVAF